MGYYSGTATDSDDMLTKIKNHVTTEGWTVHQDAVAGAGRVLRISTSGTAGIQYVLRSTGSGTEKHVSSTIPGLAAWDYAGISMVPCTGHSGGTGTTDWVDNATNSPMYNITQKIHCGAYWGAGAISSYEMFFDKDHEFAVLAMNISGSTFQTMVFGDPITYGSSTPGANICAAPASTLYNHGNGSYDFTSVTQNPVHFCSPLNQGGASGFVRWHGDTAARHWASNGNPNYAYKCLDEVYGNRAWWDHHLFESSINDYNGLHCLNPIHLHVLDDDDGTKYIPYARLPNMFQCHMRGLSPGDSYFVGEFEYIVFPYYFFKDVDLLELNIAGDNEHSGTWGFAVRKDV